MPYCTAQDGTRLWFEDQGSGPTIIFAHEFGGDLRSWDLQVNDLYSESFGTRKVLDFSLKTDSSPTHD